MFTWFATTLRQYPEIAIFLVLALGYYFGKFTFKGIGLGSVTATLLAGVLVGQIGTHDFAASQGDSVSHVPVRGRLRLWGRSLFEVWPKTGCHRLFSQRSNVFSAWLSRSRSRNLLDTIWATRRASIRVHKRFLLQWAFRQMPSTEWEWRRIRPKRCSIRCRSLMP